MVLQSIQKIVEQVNFVCSFSAASESYPMERLIIFAGQDNQQRERTVAIMAREQQFDPTANQKTQGEHYYRIQFSSLLPFQATPMALNQTASLILFLNQLIDWPGFELDELTNQISFRYIWLTKESSIDSQLLLTILGSILLNLDMFSQSIEQIAEGQSTFNELLESILKFGGELRQEDV